MVGGSLLETQRSMYWDTPTCKNLKYLGTCCNWRRLGLKWTLPEDGNKPEEEVVLAVSMFYI